MLEIIGIIVAILAVIVIVLLGYAATKPNTISYTRSTRITGSGCVRLGHCASAPSNFTSMGSVLAAYWRRRKRSRSLPLAWPACASRGC